MNICGVISTGFEHLVFLLTMVHKKCHLHYHDKNSLLPVKLQMIFPRKTGYYQVINDWDTHEIKSFLMNQQLQSNYIIKCQNVVQMNLYSEIIIDTYRWMIRMQHIVSCSTITLGFRHAFCGLTFNHHLLC